MSADRFEEMARALLSRLPADGYHFVMGLAAALRATGAEAYERGQRDEYARTQRDVDEARAAGRRAGLEEAAGVCRQFYDDPNRPRDSSVLGYLAGNLRDRAKEPAPVCAKCAADVRVTPGTCECPIPVREGRGRGVATVRAPAPCAKCGEPWERHTLTLPAGAVGRYDVPCPVKPAPSGGKGEP
jgi:hypothetical protein